MTSVSIDYATKTKVELVALCKERGIKGYASVGSTKEKIIQLLQDDDLTEKSIDEDYSKMKYDKLLKLCKERKIRRYFVRNSSGTIIATKEMMIKALKENNIRKSLFDYLTEHDPLIITKFVGNIDDLKIVSHGTNNYYTWICDTLECLNTFEAMPQHLFNQYLPRKHCITCMNINRGIKCQVRSLKKSGTIKQKFPGIENIWSNENKKTPDKFSPGSNKKIKLKCPNKSAKHPDYEIAVYHIQEHNCFRCPKCITKSSNAEMRIYSELKYSFKDVKWQQKIENREADIIVEDLKLVIEIDGYPWHMDKSEKDLAKNAIFEKNGYSVLRIRDPRLDKILCNTIICDIINLSLISYNKIIEWINNRFKSNIIINNEWKKTEYYKEIQISKMSIKYEDSIEYLFPQSKELWDYEKNYPFIPSQFTQGSCMEIWIKCSSGHVWKRKLSHLFRTIKGKKHIMNCPECSKPISNKRAILINGIRYRSILEFCRQKNIDNNFVYRELKKNKIDITLITSIQTFIETNLDSLIKK